MSLSYDYIQIQKGSKITLIFNRKFKLLWMYITKRSCNLSAIIYTVKIINEALCLVEMFFLNFIKRN